MYEAFFQLQRRPFLSTPDATCFYDAEPIETAIAQLQLCAEHGQGIGILTAAAGTGKTLLCRRLALQLSDRYHVAFLASANFPTRRALLQTILFELGQQYGRLDEQELRLQLVNVLKGVRPACEAVVVIVDEAHLLSDRLLEEIRTLADISVDGIPLARVILAGQLALEEKLAQPPLEALNQRVGAHAYLENLSREQSLEYIAHRLQWAGGDAELAFAEDALDLIATAAGGLPRCLNQLADHSLLLSYVAEQPVVTAATVREALADLRQLPLHWNEPIAAREPLDDLAPPRRDEAPAPWTSFEDSAWTEFEESAGDAASPSEDYAGDELSFEVGAETGEFLVEPVAPPRPQAFIPQNRPPAANAGKRTDAADEVEEPVVDRYVVLDSNLEQDSAGRPAVGGYECRPCDQSAQLTPEPVAVPEPERLIDEVLPLLREAWSLETPLPSAPELWTGSTSDLDGPSQLALRPESGTPLEERIGAEVLEVCLAAQKMVNERNSDGPRRIPDRQQPARGPSPVAPVPSPLDEFDTVEPEPEVIIIDESAAGSTAFDQAEATAAGRESCVQQPNYKRIFSRLRRQRGNNLLSNG